MYQYKTRPLRWLLPYDSFGRRTGKTINGSTTNFVYDGLNPVQEKNGGTVTANLLTGLGIDEFFTRTDSVGVRALLPDALGSTIALGDNTGTLQTQYTYEPFGITTQTGLTSTSSYKYTGREEDGTGLYYYRVRHYLPRFQRFIAEDPIGFLSGDANLYAYVYENPVLLRDPNGLLGFGGAAALGCGTGVGLGYGGRKPILGSFVGGLVGCTYSPLLVGLQLLPQYRALSIGLGAYLGAVSGASVAAAQGGSLTAIGFGFLSGAAGGAIGGAIPGPFASTFAGQGTQAVISYGLGLLK